jgi:DNA-binding transcriptional regulator YiaG
LTANQYRAALATLGLSQAKAAAFLGVSLRSSSGWARGEYPVPIAIAKLLKLMVKREIAPEEVK